MDKMPKLSQVAGVLAALVVVAGCGSSATQTLAPIPPLVGGSRSGAAAMPAIGFVSPGAIVYRVGGTLPALPTHATVYQADEATTSARVARLAGALGLSGSVRPDSSGWSVQDGERSLQVQRTGSLPWTLSSSGGGSVSSGCVVASPPSSGVSGLSPPATSAVPPPACPTTTTAPGLPTKADAERRARGLLTDAGFDLSGTKASSTGGIDSWYVSFTATIAGVPVLGTWWSVTVGAKGTVLSASGRLADPVAAGDYPLVGVSTGLQRLQEGGNWIVYSGPAPMLGGAPANGSSTPTASGVPSPGAATTTPAPGGSTAGEPTMGTTTAVPPTGTAAPNGPPGSTPGSGPEIPPSTVACRHGEPCPPVPTTTTPASIPPVVETITGVHLALTWAWPLDPSSPDAWLVPVYVFELTGRTAYPLFGHGVPVLAVAARYVAARPSTTIPMRVTKPGTAPTADTVTTTPAPSATAPR